MRWCPAGAWFPQPGAPAAGQPSATRVQHGLPQAELADLIGIRGDQAAAVISELDVILIHIRAGQAAQYERLYVVPELPRWHEAPSSVPGSFVLLSAPASIRMQPRTSSPSRSQTTPGTLSTTPIPVPGAQPASLTHSSPRTRWYTAERCRTPSDRHSASATAPGSPTGEAGDATGARDQFAALLPIRKRVSGPGDPGTPRAHASLLHWTGQTGEANRRMRPGRAIRQPKPSDSQPQNVLSCAAMT
jgi:hypothetical protein